MRSPAWHQVCADHESRGDAPTAPSDRRRSTMMRRGVLYDVARVMGANWRPDYDPGVVRRELEIIKTDLHCNTVKICGRDIGRLTAASRSALELCLEVWFSPELWNKPPDATLDHITRAAVAAEGLRETWPVRVVFVVRTRLTLFMRRLIESRTFGKRIRAMREAITSEAHNKPLNAFLREP